MVRSRLALGVLLASAAALCVGASCNVVTGLSDYEKSEGAGGSGTGGSPGAGGAGGGGPATIPGKIATLNTGRFGTCAITEDKQLYCWGLYPGVAGTAVSTVPVRVDVGGAVETVALGQHHRCAVVTGVGGPEILCWGDNSRGQLAAAPGGVSFTPVLVASLSGLALDTIAAGHSHACAYGDDGLYCWGDNSFGQAGVAAEAIVPPTPVAVPDVGGTGGGGGGSGGGEWDRAGAGLFFTCGIARASTGATQVYCWGSNDGGQLGVSPGTLDQTAVPRAINEAPAGVVERVYPGGRHVCVRNIDKELYCLGANDVGQLGLGTITPQPQTTLAQVVLPENLDTLSAGAEHNCARFAVAGGEYETLCWGSNASGQLNVGTGDVEPTPKAIVFERTTAISYGRSQHACMVKTADGSLWCWGSNEMGQLGVGTVSAREAAPVQVAP